MAKVSAAHRIKPPCFVELQSLKDLGRLACAFERAPIPVFAMESHGVLRLAVQMDLFMGRPLFYYAKTEGLHHFLGYRNTSGAEEVVLTDSASNPSFIHSPIIAMQSLPKVFLRGLERPVATQPKYFSSELRDLASLAKVCSYKTIFEEPPLPTFAFARESGGAVLGAFTRMDDFEESSMFFFVRLTNPPSEGFMKFSSRDVASTGFTGRIDEHGYIFIKIIRLVREHPLVEID